MYKYLVIFIGFFMVLFVSCDRFEILSLEEYEKRYSTTISSYDIPIITTTTEVSGTTTSTTVLGSTTTIDINNVSYREMVSITGGTYDQEDTYTNHFNHTISSFSIAKYEVTYELWWTVYQWAINNGYTFANKGVEGYLGFVGASPTSYKYEPVTCINWRDAIVWCNAYSEMMGFTPVYTSYYSTIKDSRDSNGIALDDAECDWNANGYRLPTEGEWQFVASNKGATPYNCASGATGEYNDSTVAWYSDNSGNMTHNVGTKTANELGLYDMSGKVSEWCWDWYGSNSYLVSETNYRGASNGSKRILRGGNWYDNASFLQVGYRDSNKPDEKYTSIGFRVARSN